MTTALPAVVWGAVLPYPAKLLQYHQLLSFQKWYHIEMCVDMYREIGTTKGQPACGDKCETRSRDISIPEFTGVHSHACTGRRPLSLYLTSLLRVLLKNAIISTIFLYPI